MQGEFALGHCSNIPKIQYHSNGDNDQNSRAPRDQEATQSTQSTSFDKGLSILYNILGMFSSSASLLSYDESSAQSSRSLDNDNSKKSDADDIEIAIEAHNFKAKSESFHRQNLRASGWSTGQQKSSSDVKSFPENHLVAGTDVPKEIESSTSSFSGVSKFQMEVFSADKNDIFYDHYLNELGACPSSSTVPPKVLHETGRDEILTINSQHDSLSSAPNSSPLLSRLASSPPSNEILPNSKADKSTENLSTDDSLQVGLHIKDIKKCRTDDTKYPLENPSLRWENEGPEETDNEIKEATSTERNQRISNIKSYSSSFSGGNLKENTLNPKIALSRTGPSDTSTQLKASPSASGAGPIDSMSGSPGILIEDYCIPKNTFMENMVKASESYRKYKSNTPQKSESQADSDSESEPESSSTDSETIDEGESCDQDYFIFEDPLRSNRWCLLKPNRAKEACRFETQKGREQPNHGFPKYGSDRPQVLKSELKSPNIPIPATALRGTSLFVFDKK